MGRRDGRRVLPEASHATVVWQKLVKPTTGAASAAAGASPACTHLASTDVYLYACGTAHAWGFKGVRISEDALEAAVRATVTDLPFLAGRMGGLKSPTMAEFFIEHTGEGALLTLAKAGEGVRLSSMSPESWQQWDIVHEKVPPPFYMDGLDATETVLSTEPVLKVRLTRVEDGDILAVTINHVVSDGMHLEQLLRHLCARYRQHVSGAAEADAEHLLHPTDRSWLTPKNLAAHLMGEEAAAAWKPPPLKLATSFLRLLRAMRAVWALSKERSDIVRLHIPEADILQLKAWATEGSKVVGLTRGDAVQAAVALLQHAALGRPLLPVTPWKMGVLLQLPTPPGYFGNLVYQARFSLPDHVAQPRAGEYPKALRLLAGEIRKTVADARSKPDHPLSFLHMNYTTIHSPISTMVTYYYGHYTKKLSCVTNYVPMEKNLDLGLGVPAAYHNEMTTKRMKDMPVVRAASGPEFAPADAAAGGEGSSGGSSGGNGLLLSLCLTRKQAKRLAKHSVLRELVPGARLVGASSRYSK